MRIIRVVAIFRDGGHSHKNYKLILVCGVGHNQRIADGEWMGYIQNESVYWPFILKNNESFFYGGEEHYTEPTNIGRSVIEKGQFFTIFSPPSESSSWQSTYEIVSCHPYEC